MEYNPQQMPQVPREPMDSDEVYAIQQQENRVGNLISQIAPDNQLLDLQWRIKGFVKDPVSGTWQKVTNAQEPHPILVSRYISYLSSILNQNTTLSNYSSMEINQIMGLIIEWVVDNLDANSEIYGLEEDYTERTRIGHLLLNSTMSAFKRSQNGMESRRIFSALNVRESLHEGGEKKGGVMESLKFWK